VILKGQIDAACDTAIRDLTAIEDGLEPLDKRQTDINEAVNNIITNLKVDVDAGLELEVF
jgi:hypothetical protein